MPLASNNRNLFRCAANQQAPPWTNNIGLPQLNPSYEYNMAGTARFNIRNPVSLGLDPGDGFLAEKALKVPADLVAVCDAKPTLVGSDRDADDLPVNLLVELTAGRHDNGARTKL